MFQFRRIESRQGRGAWIASAALHAIVIALVLAIAWRVRPHTTFITLAVPVVRRMPPLPPTGGSERDRGPSGGLGNPVPVTGAPREQAAPAPVGKLDSTLAVNSSAVGRHIVKEPSFENPLIWVGPRPALPAEVADVLYGHHDPRDPIPRDSVVVRRLRAMVDSMNRIIDADQRQRRKPSWTTETAGKKFGMDSSSIYIAGLKIPNAVLLALGSMLPPGNYDEGVRSQQLADIRADMLQAARRSQTLQEFRGYVKEFRERKQAERDFARHQHDTTVATPDTVKMVP